MRHTNRALVLTLLASSVAGQMIAQTKAPLKPTSDPFTIKPGSTFSASGGTPNMLPDSSEFVDKPSRIAAEILEAQKLIIDNYLGGRKLAGDALTKTALDGMLRSLDPHSSFFDQSEWKELFDEQRSGYTGIGATISNFERNGEVGTFVLSTFPGSPASRAQLRFGDLIVAINGENMSGKNSDIVRDKIRGALGTTFRLTIERAATNRIETIDIRRNRVPQPSIPDAYILRPGIGYIDLSEGFNFTTGDEFTFALSELRKQGMRSLVLDLRGNGGGIVDQAVSVAERFLPSGTLILTQKGRSRLDNRVWRSRNTNPEQFPLVVLVNEDTASASEIVAGAFQDDDRAMIVGERTFGKGLVQSVIDLPGRTGLTLTTGRYLTPAGRSIQRDYSKLDLYDYFNHRTKAAEIGKAHYEARTITDRKVYGGDGIQPDELVKAERLNDTKLKLLDPIFVFARDVVNGRVSGLEEYRSNSVAFGRRVTPGDFPVTDKLVSAFVDFATKDSAKLSLEELHAEASFIRLRLRYNIVMASFGAVSAAQVLIEDDPQVAKAVEILPRAAQLAELARKLRSKQR